MASAQKQKHDLVLTHLDKVFWKEEGYTKQDVITYYREIAPTILPYLKDRPMVMNRHPNGIDGESFFQKNIEHPPSWIKTAAVEHSERTIHYILVQNEDTLLYVANLGCIELNPFHSRIKHLEEPDYLIIDLDPEDVPFEKMIEAAQMVRKILEALEMHCYCKTSGGRGLHIYVPLAAKYDFDQVEEMSRLIALLTFGKLPDLISLERRPAKRQKKIYIDFPRNTNGQTIAAPYSIRPRPHAPVSTPLEWKEVKKGLNPLDFTIKTVLKRVDRVGDLFKPILGKGANLSKSLKLLNNLF